MSYQIISQTPHVELVSLFAAIVGSSFVIAGAIHFLANLFAGMHRIGDMLFASIEPHALDAWDRHVDFGVPVMMAALFILIPYALEAAVVLAAIGCIAALANAVYEYLKSDPIDV
jgi:hypothetical protein